jgi:hypothetical protein
MSNITPGRIVPTFRPDPLRHPLVTGNIIKRFHNIVRHTSSSVVGIPSSRAYGGLIWKCSQGNMTISGVTRSGGVIVSRRLILIRQDQPSNIIGETVSNAITGAYRFTGLPYGRYMVIDIDPASFKRGLVYDWVISG